MRHENSPADSDRGLGAGDCIIVEDVFRMWGGKGVDRIVGLTIKEVVFLSSKGLMVIKKLITLIKNVRIKFLYSGTPCLVCKAWSRVYGFWAMKCYPAGFYCRTTLSPHPLPGDFIPWNPESLRYIELGRCMSWIKVVMGVGVVSELMLGKNAHKA
jgi:hypothetical protein